MNNTCGDRDCFVCYPDDPSILAENKILKEALEKIKTSACICTSTHRVSSDCPCHIAQEALKKISA